MTLAHLLARQARVAPDRTAIFQGAQPWATHAQWARRSAGLAWRLRQARLLPGDRVVLFMRNHPRYLEILWGAWWAGLVVVPVNARLHPAEVEWIIDDAQARWAFVTTDSAPHALAGLQWQVDAESAQADEGHPRHAARLASVGVAQTPVRVRVAAADGTDRPPGEPGEVLAQGDTVMQGYWRDPAATAAALRDGWLWTGDVGCLDADGFLTLMDRSKDLLISGRSNIYPREVEEVLLTAPGVAEVAVVGAPDPQWGEIVVAFVVPQPGAAPDEAALDADCLECIARFKRPKRYVFVTGLPKNHYGKVLKTELRERLRGGT
jgi:acyl-CoA synthetase (AMP-forming)/AMP-acid ligase II